MADSARRGSMGRGREEEQALSERGSGGGGLEGRAALVTGASSGLGRAVAVALAEAGADVALVARSDKDLRETGRLLSRRARRERGRADVARDGPPAFEGRRFHRLVRVLPAGVRADRRDNLAYRGGLAVAGLRTREPFGFATAPVRSVSRQGSRANRPPYPDSACASGAALSSHACGGITRARRLPGMGPLPAR